jgi:uncharacterized membrane protein (UPF0127 family)
MAGQGTFQIGDKQWAVSLALTSWEIEQGLGGVVELPANTGMLFDMGDEQTIDVTTVPMLFSLDIAFLSNDLAVTEVYQNVAPGYLVTSQVSARYFLEVNAGELDDIEVGSQAQAHIEILEPPTPDWTSAMIGFAGFMLFGILMVGMVRDFTSEAFKEPEKKPLVYGPREEKLLAQTSGKADLWTEVTSVIESDLGKKTDFSWGERRQIAELVAHRIDKRAGELAWLELRDGTTFDREGKAQVKQGLKLFAALDGYLGLLTKLNHTERVAIAEIVDDNLKPAGVILLRDGTAFRKSFSPNRSSPAVIPRKYNAHPPKHQDELDLLPDSPEYLAYTIEDIGFRDIIDSAFKEAISRAKGLRWK